MEKNDGIANWQFCGVKHIGISVNEVEIDGEVCYNPVLNVFLETFEGSEEDKVISLATDHFCTSARGSAHETAKQLIGMFENVSANVVHFNESGDVVAEYDLNEDFAEYDDLESLEKDNSKNITVH